MPLFQVEQVTHTVLLGLEIAEVILVGSNLDGHILDNLQTVGLETHSLDGVVGQQSHLVDSQMAQHLCSTTIVSLVGLESKMYIGVDSVKTFFLELIGCDLVHKTNAATLLLHVYQHTLTFFLDGLHSLVELFAAVAALGTEDVARHAGGVYSHQHWLVFLPLALDERQVLQTIALLTEGDEFEVSVFRRHVYLFANLD